MTATRETTASAQQVWDVLADGWKFSGWVVGASRIRAVDADWPQPNSRISHSVGPWPALINDETVVENVVPERELVLRAKLWPVGEALVTMRLHSIPGGCRMEMSEVVATKPLDLIPDKVQLAAFWHRNHECLLRLALIAEGKKPDDV
ncbi:SRPBCC family protein [Antrihabitans sp. YC2-6]|uniref:SRPBCC family protein n=1 Tax=Antrihabitans sp. YC2-6 TaxID=2799498 RepID=UPI0018F4DA09|nr:SRPBCC family protein [Antrihabitans sp. YC2-6]MBJ8347067.1 SRPBCC family protein [Antrihabitans sp. YC2-6]